MRYALLILLALGVSAQPLRNNSSSLSLGAHELQQKQYSLALQHLEDAGRRFPKLVDYTAYLSAAARFEIGNYADLDRVLKPVWDLTPVSPLIAKAAILLANAYLREAQPRKAIALVERHAASLKIPEAEILLAHAYADAGDSKKAASHFEKILAEYPLSTEASDAGTDPSRLASMPAKMRLARCIKLLEGGNPTRAREEIDIIAPQLAGVDLDIAHVKRGAAQFSEGAHQAAFDYLGALHVSAPEADAERLYLIIRCARRLDSAAEVKRALAVLETEHRQSPWRLQALLSAGDFFWFQNAAASYEPIYRACAAAFAPNAEASKCQWRAAWAAHTRRDPAANAMFLALVKQFPTSEKASASLYFMGRTAESIKDWGAARAYYEQIDNAYPNYFYATLARQRLKSSPMLETAPGSGAVAWLNSIQFPSAPRRESLAASPTMQVRLERARLLASAGLNDLAESELKFSARNDGQPLLAAIDLADLASERDAPDLALRYIKQLAPNYLRTPLNALPDKFWKLAFPLPYRDPLERYSREHGLDPFLVAALIRQESEFDTHAVSRANAYGLTQVLPSTGREIGRKLGLAGFHADSLFQPEMNLRIGTYFLKSLLDRQKGKWELTLTAYNAGPGRVTKWLTWGDYQEPAEFIETIPFDETRNYVQSVLRNADLYARLYGSLYGAKAGALASSDGNISRKDAGAAGPDRKPAAAIP